MKKQARKHLQGNFLVLCRQYSALGTQLRAEVEAINAGDTARAIEAKRAIIAQYREMGEQLKLMGESVDRA